MPYVPGNTTQSLSFRPEVKDVYKSSNVFVNFVEVALYNDEESPEAAVIAEILSPTYIIDQATLASDGENNDNGKETEKNQQRLIEEGLITQEQLNKAKDVTPSRKDELAKKVNPPLFTTSTVNTGTVSFSSTFTLTTSSTLGSVVLIPPTTHGIKSMNDLSVENTTVPVGVVVENLQLLTLNCIQPIRAKYPNMYITNSFREKFRSKTGSLHPTGMAVDLQFNKIAKKDYYDIALWIRDNISFDMLILEYKTTGSGNPWIHISFNKNGNRNLIYTYINDKYKMEGLGDFSNI